MTRLAAILFLSVCAALVSRGEKPIIPLDEFRQILVLESGRIKPMETLARFRLYHLSGKRALKFGVDDGEEIKTVKIGPVEWYLDCLFRPEVATKIPFILVDNVDVAEVERVETAGDQHLCHG